MYRISAIPSIQTLNSRAQGCLLSYSRFWHFCLSSAYASGRIWFPAWVAKNPTILCWLTQVSREGHPCKLLTRQVLVNYKEWQLLPGPIKPQKVLYFAMLLVNPIVCPLLVRLNQWTNFLTALDLSIKQLQTTFYITYVMSSILEYCDIVACSC